MSTSYNVRARLNATFAYTARRRSLYVYRKFLVSYARARACFGGGGGDSNFVTRPTDNLIHNAAPTRARIPPFFFCTGVSEPIAAYDAAYLITSTNQPLLDQLLTPTTPADGLERKPFRPYRSAGRRLLPTFHVIPERFEKGENGPCTNDGRVESITPRSTDRDDGTYSPAAGSIRITRGTGRGDRLNVGSIRENNVRGRPRVVHYIVP